MHVLWSPTTVPLLQQNIYLILHLYRRSEKFLWGLGKPNKIVLLSFFENRYNEKNNYGIFSHLEMQLRGIRDKSVRNICTELSSLVLACLNRYNVMYLATCRSRLRNSTSWPGWAEGRGAKAAGGTPAPDVCAIMLNAVSWRYFCFLGFPIPLIIISCLWHICLFQQAQFLWNTWSLLLSMGYGQMISGAWKAGATAEPGHHAGMCCQAFFHADFWFFLLPKSNNICISKYNYKQDFFTSMTATSGQACGKLPAVQRFSKYGHFIQGQFCSHTINWQTADWFFKSVFIYAVCLTYTQWCCIAWIWKI